MQPLPPRRRARLLVIITVVALIPVGIGFGISLAAGGGTGRVATTPAGKTGAAAGSPATNGTSTGAPSGLTHPPAATLASGTTTKVKALLGSYCWQRPGRPGSGETIGQCVDVGANPSPGEPVLHLARGAQVTLSFATKAVPTSVGIAPGHQPATPLHVGTPIRFSVNKTGSYPVILHTTWGAGDQASYRLRFDVR